MNGPPRPPLRLVHPAKPPEPDNTPRTRSGKKRPHQTDLFTLEEHAMLCASLRTARGLFGTWACLADAMRMPREALNLALRSKRISAAIAVRLSRALGVPLDTLTRPGLRLVPFPKVCPTCGKG